MSHLPARIERPVVAEMPARKPRHRKPHVVAEVTLYDPRKVAALRTAQALGCPLSVAFDGYRLIVTASHAHAGGGR